MNKSISCTSEIFGKLPDNSDVLLYRMHGGNGVTAEILSYGATIHRLYTPDRDGKIADIVLGRNNLKEYMEAPNVAGSVIGRVANRISGAQFAIGEKVYHTEVNSLDYTLHSGSGNYAKRNFTGKVFNLDDRAGVVLSLRDNGEGGFPGGMDVSVTYSLDEKGNLSIFYETMPEEDTPINMTNHVYFNLAGHGAGSVANHILQLNSDFFMPDLADSMPTGEILSVKNTAMDFTAPKTLGEGFDSNDPHVRIVGGYDHHYCIRGRGMRRGGFVKDPSSGRCLEFFTDMPGVQLYTGVHTRDSFPGKDGAVYQKLHSFCLETQNNTNAINWSHLPSMLYKAGVKFESETIYRFYAE
ncbi:MAG: galactose mutarotase [Treponema sp.]|nr:galactose mutarotase [Treponema sp.]